MAANKSVKATRRACRIVGVIRTRAELAAAIRMSSPPDLFELRLDHLIGQERMLDQKISMLRAPIIITARHPVEGGANHLSTKKRRELLAHFLRQADYVDLELRSAKNFQELLQQARRRNVRRIISFHDFNSTPYPRSLHAKARAAALHGADVFKVATRTDTPVQLARLLEFVANEKASLIVSAMGMGKLGAVSRITLARNGGGMIYGSVGKPHLEGQLSVRQLRQALNPARG